MPVGGEIDGPQYVGRVEQAVKELERPRRRDELEGQTERLGPSGLAAQLLHARCRRRQPQGTDLVPAGIVTSVVFKRR